MMRQGRGEVLQSLHRLRQRLAQFNELLDMFGDSTVLRGDQKALAQARLKALKSELRSEVKSSGQTEYWSYSHPLAQALASIHVRYNSIPNHKWFEQLYSARASIEIEVYRIEESLRNADAEDSK